MGIYLGTASFFLTCFFILLLLELSSVRGSSGRESAETQTEEKQAELIINKSNGEQDNCECVCCGLKQTEVEKLIIVNMLTTWKK